ncbi:MAG TPA: hypothetical protein VMV53_05625 [Acidimicrobiales bacterium]|nr:hypothetical protein [Acidimicrobiales bacterium]
MTWRSPSVTRRRASVAGAGLAAALALSSCSSAPATTATLVPWLALAPVATTTTTTTATPLAPAAPCTADHLRATTGQGGAGLGHELSVIVITNTGPTCRLGGYPDLYGTTPTRTPGMMQVTKSGTYFGNLIPADLAPRQRGELLLGTGEACPALNEPSQAQDLANQRADTYHGVTIVLAHGAGSLRVPGVTVDVACGLDESRLGVQGPQPGEITNPPGSPQTLQANVTLPLSTDSATTLRYVVALHNPSRTTVTWSHCPNYTETILTTPEVGGSQRFSRTYQLNCRAAKSVRPGRTETFVMQFPIGAARKSSQAKFAWQLDTGNGPYAGHALLVFAAH